MSVGKTPTDNASSNKGSKQRLVPIQSKMRQVSQRYLRERGNALADALFLTVDNSPLAIGSIQKLIKEYGEQAHITDVRVSPHTFRIPWPSSMSWPGATISGVMTFLGVAFNFNF